MSEQDQMQELYRLVYDKHGSECIKKNQIYEVIKANKLFTDIDLSSKAGQTVFGMMFSEYHNRSLGGILLTIYKRSKNNALYSFNELISSKKKEPLKPSQTPSLPVETPVIEEVVDKKEDALTQEERPQVSDLTNKKDWTKKFLECYVRTWNVIASCKFSGITKPTYYRRMELDPEFKAAIESVSESRIDALEDALYKRAMKNSDTIGLAMIKAWKRERYGDKQEVKHDVHHTTHITFSSENIKAIEEARKSYQQKFGEALPDSVLKICSQASEEPQAKELTLKPEDVTIINKMREDYERTHGKD